MANQKVYLQMLDETSGEYVNVDPRSCAEAITCNKNITLQNHLTTIYTNQGDLNNLNTAVKDNLVDAINEIKSAETGSVVYYATITTTWQLDDVAPYMQRIDIDGITEADVPIVDVLLDADTTKALVQLDAWSLVSKIETKDGYIVVTCLEEKPTIEIPIQLKIGVGSETMSPLPITHGGTGATTTEKALINLGVESLINGHISDASAHLSEHDRATLDDPFVIRVFAGTGESTQVYKLPFYPRIVFVMRRNAPFTEYDSVNNYTIVNAGIVSANGGGGTAGISMFLDEVTISQSTAASDGKYINLNKSGAQYICIAFK